MKKNIYVSIIGIFLLTIIVSGIMICHHYKEAAEQNDLYDNLVEIVEDSEETLESESEESEATDDTTPFSEYEELYRQNPDMVGWIKIEDTKINYPVMQSVDEPNFYLKHGFDRSYTDYGCPYVQENCDVLVPSDNVVIYAHHMNDGSMFAALDDYKSKSFWEEHKTITFDTLTQHNEYEIVAVFKTVVYTSSPESFKYYHFTDAETEADFNDYIAKCKELSLYDTGVSAEYGDKLITLSTCEYSQTNGRIVVVAKLIK